jgi:hypothetical protein
MSRSNRPDVLGIADINDTYRTRWSVVVVSTVFPYFISSGWIVYYESIK